MTDAELYSSQDIEQLKQRIAIYRDTLLTLKTGNTTDDYHFIKNELNDFKSQVSQLEEEMKRLKDNRSIKVEEYEHLLNLFSRQLGSLNQAVEEVNHDLSIVMKKQLNDLPEKVDESIIVQDSVAAENQMHERISIEEKKQKTEQIPLPSNRPSSRLPSFKQLQSLAGKPRFGQDVPSHTTHVENIPMQNNDVELQTIHNYRFPVAGNHPNHIYNGLYRKVNKTSTVHVTNVAKKQEVSIIEDDHLEPLPHTEQGTSHLLPISEPKENEEIVQYEEEEYAFVSLPVEDHLIEDKETIVEVEEVPFVITNEMKRQQHKNKETLSLFNFFRKKN